MQRGGVEGRCRGEVYFVGHQALHVAQDLGKVGQDEHKGNCFKEAKKASLSVLLLHRTLKDFHMCIYSCQCISKGQSKGQLTRIRPCPHCKKTFFEEQKAFHLNKGVVTIKT